MAYHKIRPVYMSAVRGTRTVAMARVGRVPIAGLDLRIRLVHASHPRLAVAAVVVRAAAVPTALTVDLIKSAAAPSAASDGDDGTSSIEDRL